MRRSTLLVVVLALPAPVHRAVADSKFENVSGASITVAEPVPGVSPLLSPTTQALVSAGLSTTTDGAQFRATVVPMRAFDALFIPILSEAKLSIVTDTDRSLTQTSLTLAYNPFSLRRRRATDGGGDIASLPRDECPKEAAEILKKLQSPEQQCGDHQLLYVCAHDPKAKLVDANKAAHDELEAAKRSFWTAVSDLTKLSTGDTRDDRLGPLLRELTRATERLDTLPREIAERGALIEALTMPAEIKKQTDTCERRRLARQWPQINSTAIPMVGVTGFIDSYPYGRGPDPLDTTGQTSVDLEHWGGWGLQPFLSFHLTERLSVDVHGSWKRTRAKGDPHTKLARTFGGGITAAWQVHQFLKKQDLDNDDDYIKSGFIPGLSIGASVQRSDCDGLQHCAKQRTEQTSVTPFFEIRASTKLQLRLSLPLVWYSSTDKDGNDVVPTFSLAGQISSL